MLASLLVWVHGSVLVWVPNDASRISVGANSLPLVIMHADME